LLFHKKGVIRVENGLINSQPAICSNYY